MKKPLIKIILNDYVYPLIAAFLISSSIIQGSIIPTGSMEETIRTGDCLFFNRLAYDFASPRVVPWTDIRLPYFSIKLSDGPDRGDIVVFDWPGDRDEYKTDIVFNYVKRCVGLPGDTIEVKNRILFVNGKEFLRPTKMRYASNNAELPGVAREDIFPTNSGWNNDHYGPLVVPKEGDVIELTMQNIHKWETFINREFGGKVVSIRDNKIFINNQETTSYTVQQNQYFMMGDNRDESSDSRYWGFVPRENLLGEPLFVFWSWDKKEDGSLFDILAKVRLDRIGLFL